MKPTVPASIWIVMSLPAQGPNAVAVPAAFATTDGGASAQVFYNGIVRVQCIYDADDLLRQGVDVPIDIDHLRVRAAGGLAGVAGSWPAVDLWLGDSATDHAAPSTIFAANRTARHALVHSGSVAFTGPAGRTPNDWFVDVPLATTFRFDPTAGPDLLLEIAIAAPPNVAPVPASCSFDVALHRANTIRAFGSLAAPTGQPSPFAPVVELGYTVPAGVARSVAFGEGCIAAAASFHETFAPGAFDLGGAPGVTNAIRLARNAAGGWSVAPVAGAWFQPVSAPLSLGDDAVSPGLPLSRGPLAFPGGATGALHVASNGYVWLTAAGAASPQPSLGEFLAGGPRLAPYWTDLDPSAATGGGAVHFDDDPASGAVYATWLDVPTWEPVPAAPRPASTFQVALFDSGDVEFRWRDCAAPGRPILVGFSTGNGAIDGGAIDLTSAMPFATAAEQRPLRHVANGRPVLGATISLVTSDIPGTAVFNALWIGTAAFDPGLPLDLLGMPGCTLHVGLVDSVLFGGTGTVALPLAVPLDPAWIGRVAATQAGSLVPGINPLGVLSSNGNVLQFGTL